MHKHEVAYPHHNPVQQQSIDHDIHCTMHVLHARHAVYMHVLHTMC